MSIAEKYKIIGKLGNQKVRKFGQLYSVEDKASGSKAVLKAVQKTNKNQHIVDRLNHEAHFNFDFKGLPKIIDRYSSDTELMVVRDFAEGEPLDVYWKTLKKKERIPFLKYFIEQLAPIFEHLAIRKIVHCDIKPSNILIGPTNEVHLIDFGLALDTENIDQRDILFPLGFAAPELLLNRLRLVNQTTDIYALGILIWRLFAGKLPLTHPNPSIFTNLQLTHPLPHDSSIPKSLFPILEKMTHKHQFLIPPNKMKKEDVDELLRSAIAQRYQNLHEVLQDVQEIKVRKSFLPKNIFSKS